MKFRVTAQDELTGETVIHILPPSPLGLSAREVYAYFRENVVLKSPAPIHLTVDELPDNYLPVPGEVEASFPLFG